MQVIYIIIEKRITVCFKIPTTQRNPEQGNSKLELRYLGIYNFFSLAKILCVYLANLQEYHLDDFSQHVLDILF